MLPIWCKMWLSLGKYLALGSLHDPYLLWHTLCEKRHFGPQFSAYTGVGSISSVVLVVSFSGRMTEIVIGCNLFLPVEGFLNLIHIFEHLRKSCDKVMLYAQSLFSAWRLRHTFMPWFHMVSALKQVRKSVPDSILYVVRISDKYRKEMLPH